jgi:hypothetical protein
MPHWLAYNTQLQISDHLFTDSLNSIEIAKDICWTTLGVNDPLGSDVHLVALGEL